MKNRIIEVCMISFCFSVLFLLSGIQVFATSEQINQSGSVSVKGDAKSGLIDPEHPGEMANPGIGPSTNGLLRIDYVSSLDFGTPQIQKGDQIYEGLAQQYYGDTGPRGSHIQITDQRTVSTGWTLLVKQNYQFRNTNISNKEEQELKGAVLSLDKAWANTSGHSVAPIVTRETIEINAIDTFYELAKAKSGSGQGVWTIAFGASEANQNSQEPTLTPMIDEKGESVLDSIYEKQIYSNSAISLVIPKNTTIYPVEYATEFTWMIGALP